MGLFDRKKKEKGIVAAEIQPAVSKPASHGPDLAGAKAALVLKALRAPHVTEKAVAHTAQGQYVFVVASTVNKLTVSKAIHARYGVKPVKINIVNVKGKKTGFRGSRGVRKDWKKAYVMLRKGDTIPTEAASD